MKIASATPHDRDTWNEFVRKHYPPIGNFMLSWEWGAFQKKLGRATERFYLTSEEGETQGLFTLVYYPLPFGFSYAYLPRGPLLADTAIFPEALRAIEKWAKETLSECIFLRLEPPIETFPEKDNPLYRTPDHYVQPRFNAAIPLEGDILARMHPSTRSNIARAERRGASVTIKDTLSESDFTVFKQMIRNTIERNSGVNAYPEEGYFRAFLRTFGEDCRDGVCTDGISMKAFCGYRDGEPAGTHLVLYYGDTATYLFGASLTKHLDSKISTYLHYKAAEDAQKNGYRYYDIGGIDMERWPTLTEFKRQFRGEEFSYMGNIDLLIRPGLYALYTRIRTFKEWLRSFRRRENKKPTWQKKPAPSELKHIPA